MKTTSKKILIVYVSQTGFTKTYSDWIVQELKAEAIPLKSARAGCTADYDIIICGGGVCGNAINGIGRFKRLQKHDSNKPFIFFATGLRPPTEKTLEIVKNYNFEDKSTIPFFYLQGGMNYKKLESKQKAMVMCFKAMIKRRQQISEEDCEMLKLLQESHDFTDPLQIAPLVEYVDGIA